MLSRITLFDEIERTDTAPSGYSQPRYDYLHRSARPVAARIRVTLESWFAAYPEPEKGAFRQRFVDRDHHDSAFSELLVFAVLTNLGSRVDVHPPLAGQETHPEFLVDSTTYVEVTLATGMTAEEKRAEAAKNVLVDGLNGLHSPDWRFDVEIGEPPNTPPPVREVKRDLAAFVKGMDPDEVAELWDHPSVNMNSLPTYRYRKNGWTIDIRPFPRLQKGPARPVGMIGGVVYMVDAAPHIRKAIKTKAGHYGMLDLPYVIAVNCLAEYVTDEVIIDALFGTVVWWKPGDSPERSVPVRRPDGILKPDQNTRVSAVIIVDGANEWNVASKSCRLVYNPWAQHTYRGVLEQLPSATYDGQKGVFRNGLSLVEVLHLLPDWPGRDNRGDR